MNFLAHLHLASLAQSSLVGNLAADFIRGNPYEQYPVDIADGIMLHRRIDKLTDTLAEIKRCRQYFSQAHYRVAPITLDVVWDHFLARDWQRIEPERPLFEFMNWVEPQISAQANEMPEEFQRLNHYLWQERWLENYSDLDFIADVLQRMARRRPKLSALATSIDDVRLHYSQLDAGFWHFYPQMMKKALEQRL